MRQLLWSVVDATLEVAIRTLTQLRSGLVWSQRSVQQLQLPPNLDPDVVVWLHAPPRRPKVPTHGP